MRVVLVGFGSQGDIQPLVALGVRLRADGHDVVLGASAGFAGLVRAHGLRFRTIGHDIEAWIRRHGGVLTRSPHQLIRPIVDYLRAEVGISFEQTCAAAHGADLLVSGLNAAAPSVAERLGIPHRTLLFCPQMLRSRHHPPPGVACFGLPGFWNQLLWRAFGRGFDLILRDAINRERRAWGLPPIGDVLSYLGASRMIVASDRVLGELPPDAPPTILQTGSLALAPDDPLDPGLARFLEAGERPVYISFGSMPDDNPRRTTRSLIEALETCRRRGVVLSGWAGLGEGGVPPSVFVGCSAPHALLLPRVALAVHHGGAGTTAAAARAGVPQIVVPHAVDQYYWGHQVHARGLGGRPIPRRALTGRRLARAIEELLSRPEVAERARAIAANLEGAHSAAAIAELLYRDAEESVASRVAA